MGGIDGGTSIDPARTSSDDQPANNGDKTWDEWVKPGIRAADSGGFRFEPIRLKGGYESGYFAQVYGAIEKLSIQARLRFRVYEPDTIVDFDKQYGPQRVYVKFVYYDASENLYYDIYQDGEKLENFDGDEVNSTTGVTRTFSKTVTLNDLTFAKASGIGYADEGSSVGINPFIDRDFVSIKIF